MKRWAEYLTFVATCVFLPYELYELAHTVTVFKVGALVVNLAVAAYLLWAKRLFGVRGGGAADERARAADVGWDALERTAPPSPSARPRRRVATRARARTSSRPRFVAFTHMRGRLPSKTFWISTQPASWST